jgi:hypothetical protein
MARLQRIAADRGHVTSPMALNDNGTLDSGVHHRFLGACPPGPASVNDPVFAGVAGTGLSDGHQASPAALSAVVQPITLPAR